MTDSSIWIIFHTTLSQYFVVDETKVLTTHPTCHSVPIFTMFCKIFKLLWERLYAYVLAMIVYLLLEIKTLLG